MGGTKDKSLSSEQLNGAEKLCQLIASVPSGKRQIFEVFALAYMSGMEAGAAYARDLTKATPAR